MRSSGMLCQTISADLNMVATDSVDPRLATSKAVSRGCTFVLVTIVALAAGELKRAGADEPKASAPSGARDEVSEAPTPSDSRSTLTIIQPDKQAQDKGARPVVAMGRPTGPAAARQKISANIDIILREIVRQAVLLAARDELGLSTRDELLDDEPPGKATESAAALSVVYRLDLARALVRRGADDSGEVLMKAGLSTAPFDPDYAVQLTTQAESLSRSEFPQLLKQLGLDGQPNKRNASGSVPPKVAEQLERLGLVENFAAVRALHAVIASDGESPARLAALARGYAQLGVLSEYQWNPAHKIFKARALLYAERLRARDARSSFALRSRAFVRALVGYPAEALKDIAEAANLDKAAKHPAPAPSWLPIIEAYARFDRKGLENAGPHARLAALLELFTVEFPVGTQMTIDAARKVLKSEPDCYRAYDVICQCGRLNELHVVTELGPEVFTKSFPAKLKAIETLPRAVLERNRGELEIVEALEAQGKPAKDAGEPSWGVLAHLAREIRFVQVARRLDFMAHKWAVPVADYWADASPFVVKHRYAQYLESMTVTPDEAAGMLRKLAEQIDLAEVELTARDLLAALFHLGLPRAREAWGLAMNHDDSTARGYCLKIVSAGGPPGSYIHYLRTLSPHAPFGMATAIEDDWERNKGQVAEWRRITGDDPALLLALAKHYVAQKQYAEAEDCLTQYIKQSPDFSAFQLLASCFEATGDRERWKATLDDYLAKTEDVGLEHAKIRVQIAEDLMARKKFAEAKPYAETAAETWAAWAMMCAGHCDEALKDWDQAELWFRRTTERYPGSWSQWYLFCKRTGHGDVEAAKQGVDEYVAQVEGRPDLANPRTVGYYHWLNHSPKKALNFFRAAFSGAPNVGDGLSVFLLADSLGDQAERDQMLTTLCTTLKNQAPQTTRLCEMFRDALADQGRPLDLAAIDQIVETIPKTRENTGFVIGVYLLNRNQPDAARKYLQQVINTPDAYIWMRLVATDLVRSLPGDKKR